MRAEHFAQRFVHQVGCAVVPSARGAQAHIDLRLEGSAFRHAVEHVDNEVVFLFGVQHLEGLAAVCSQRAAIPDLATAFGIEGERSKTA